MMAGVRYIKAPENPEVPVSFGGHNLPSPPQVEIGLTDLSKSRGALPTDFRPSYNPVI